MCTHAAFTAFLPAVAGQRGVAVSTDCNGRFAKLDPYAGAQLALAEAYRNVAVAGAAPLAVTDCLNFGSPEDPGVMWQFREAIRLSPEARFYFNLCAALDRMNHDNEALQACGAVYTNGASEDLRQRTDERVKAIRAKKK